MRGTDWAGWVVEVERSDLVTPGSTADTRWRRRVTQTDRQQQTAPSRLLAS